MELQGTHQFKAPLEKVWSALLDPVILAKALPGGDQLERIGENEYKAAMHVKVGPVQGRFEGHITLSDIREREGYHMKVSGTGAPGFVNGEGTLTLSENGEGTLLAYAGDVQIGGRIASVGQRLIDSTAKSIIRQGLKTLDEQMIDGGPPAPSTVEPVSASHPSASAPVERGPQPVAATPTPSSPAHSPARPAPALGKIAVDVAKDVAQDLASDYIPREKQPQVFAFILGALSMLFFVMVVRLVQRD
jgi:carbon monoxide dehydrogenase subunit G